MRTLSLIALALVVSAMLVGCTPKEEPKVTDATQTGQAGAEGNKPPVTGQKATVNPNINADAMVGTKGK
jgi:hypothetical protein